MLLGTLGVRLLGNILTGPRINRTGEGIVRDGYGNSKKRSKKQQNGFLMPPHPLTNFEIQKFYQNEPRFNDVYSRDNLPEIKDGAYEINLAEFSNIETHRVTLYVSKDNNVTYFDSFRVEHIPKDIKAFIDR